MVDELKLASLDVERFLPVSIKLKAAGNARFITHSAQPLIPVYATSVRLLNKMRSRIANDLYPS